VNGVKAEPGRYPTYVSLRDNNSTDDSSSSVDSSTSSNGYYYTASPPPLTGDGTKPGDGASLISDWLVLTSAHCVPNNLAAQPSDFRKAGLNFTSLPNAYAPSLRYADQVTAFVGADKLAIDNSEGNPIQLWFVHPWFDINTY